MRIGKDGKPFDIDTLGGSLAKEQKMDITNLYKKYQVEIEIRDKLLGGKPKTDKLIKGWLKSRGRENTVEREIEEIDLLEEEKKAWSGFKKDNQGLYLDSYQIKGMIKEVVKVLKLSRSVRGLVNLLTSGFFIYPARIYLGKDKPDGFIEETAQVMGRMGPRSIVKRHDYVEKVNLSFEVRFFDTKVLNEETLRLILEAGQEVGLGTNRHEGGEFGKFEVIKLEKVN